MSWVQWPLKGHYVASAISAWDSSCGSSSGLPQPLTQRASSAGAVSVLSKEPHCPLLAATPKGLGCSCARPAVCCQVPEPDPESCPPDAWHATLPAVEAPGSLLFSKQLSDSHFFFFKNLSLVRKHVSSTTPRGHIARSSDPQGRKEHGQWKEADTFQSPHLQGASIPPRSQHPSQAWSELLE